MAPMYAQLFTMSFMEEAEGVVQFWCGHLDDQGLAPEEKSRRWFRKDPSFDQEIRDRFAALHARLLSGQRPEWTRSPHGLVAAVIVLDQFSRNMFRDTGAMFAGDPRALALSFEALALGVDRSAPAAHRSLLYMPLMHSEELRVQRRCVELFSAFVEESEGPVRSLSESSLGYAKAHQDIIERFGRFPHRNALLGRPTTPEEEAFLGQPGSSF